VPIRRPLACNEARLIVAVEVNLLACVAELLASFEFGDDVRVSSGGHKGREPIQTRHNAILDLTGRNTPRMRSSNPNEAVGRS
jgi:hypothetical protein